MSVHVLQAAKFASERSGWSLSNLELQKIVYLANMIHLGHYGRPLVQGCFEAWDFGPVHPTLYRHVKRFGAGPVTAISCNAGPLQGESESSLLHEAVDILSKKTGGQLVSITHWSKGAWARNYSPGERNRIISNEDVVDEYRERERVSDKRSSS